MNLLECIGGRNAALSADHRSEVVVAKKDNSLNRRGRNCILQKIIKSCNSVIHMKKRGVYKVNEMNISSPISSSVTATVFKTVPEKLKPYCKNQLIEVDFNYLIKNKIVLVTTSDCSNTGMALPENLQGDLELMKVTSGKKEYRIKDWDMTPVHAWD
ncbi:hypothetical protein [Erwinia mallotivora]|uniref:Uncharacterized protein n=1 Tax=Erwinia mallotivora TaxID=69222 RepID=A0A014M8N4_9GAMM|nr:hypothetical protein [Erwinia mallotivora]EXU74459.1 hypothetical protein BG55_16975 [Erwinia mallotivora]